MKNIKDKTINLLIAKFYMLLDDKYVIDYSIDYENNCEEAGCDSICRCSIIVDLNNVQLCSTSIVDILCSTIEYNINNIDKCLLHKYFSKLIPKVEDFTWVAVGGYYGEELESVNVHVNEIDIQNFCTELYNWTTLKDNEKVIKILMDQYGYILSEIVNKNFYYKLVDFKDIDVNDKTLKSIKNLKNIGYPDNKYAGLICQQVQTTTGKKYKLIDGHHRYAFFKSNKKTSKIGIITTQIRKSKTK